jgi:hypothetical protein
MIADVPPAVEAVVSSRRTGLAAQLAVQWVGLLAAAFWPKHLIHSEVTRLTRSWLQLTTRLTALPAVRFGAKERP